MGILKFIAFCAQIDFFGLRASTLWEPESWYVLYHDGRLQDTFSKNISFDDPQNGGHFSCRKPVSHVGTSTVSDSEALIHLAYVQHMWQSKFVVILEGLTKWRIELCWKMQLAGKWLQMHFDMHVYLLEKVLLCSFDSKNFCKICTIFGPQNGGWKMDPKMVPEFDPQNGVQKWHPKGRPNILNKALISCRSFFDQKNIGPPFWVPFLDPFWVKFWHHFWVHFSTSILGPKMVQILQKFLLSKLHSKTFSSKQACISKCICSHFPANCIFQHNSIPPGQAFQKQQQILIATCVAHKQDGLEPQNLILWRSLHATPVFYMKNDPRFGGRQSWPFCQIASFKGLHQRCNWCMRF